MLMLRGKPQHDICPSHPSCYWWSCYLFTWHFYRNMLTVRPSTSSPAYQTGVIDVTQNINVIFVQFQELVCILRNNVQYDISPLLCTSLGCWKWYVIIKVTTAHICTSSSVIGGYCQLPCLEFIPIAQCDTIHLLDKISLVSRLNDVSPH